MSGVAPEDASQATDAPSEKGSSGSTGDSHRRTPSRKRLTNSPLSLPIGNKMVTPLHGAMKGRSRS